MILLAALVAIGGAIGLTVRRVAEHELAAP
jgi:hypothetical protein